MKTLVLNPLMASKILLGEKTEHRKLVKKQEIPILYNPTAEEGVVEWSDGTLFISWNDGTTSESPKDPPYSPGETIYIQEPWNKAPKGNKFIYAADNYDPMKFSKSEWKSAVHMPRVAARLFLKITDVKINRLQNVTIQEIFKELGSITVEMVNDNGTRAAVTYKNMDDVVSSKDPKLSSITVSNVMRFIWDDHSLNKSYKRTYGFDANPWVWVFSFERVDEPK